MAGAKVKVFESSNLGSRKHVATLLESSRVVCSFMVETGSPHYNL